MPANRPNRISSVLFLAGVAIAVAPAAAQAAPASPVAPSGAARAQPPHALGARSLERVTLEGRTLQVKGRCRVNPTARIQLGPAARSTRVRMTCRRGRSVAVMRLGRGASRATRSAGGLRVKVEVAEGARRAGRTFVLRTPTSVARRTARTRMAAYGTWRGTAAACYDLELLNRMEVYRNTSLFGGRYGTAVWWRSWVNIADLNTNRTSWQAHPYWYRANAGQEVAADPGKQGWNFASNLLVAGAIEVYGVGTNWVEHTVGLAIQPRWCYFG